jgi:uncharacterized protein YbjT (DUF2867 family)
MKVLVIGATGQIGKYLIQLLKERQYFSGFFFKKKI